MKYKKPLLVFVIVAVAAAAALFLLKDNTYKYQGYRIPLNQLRISDPHPGCDYTHYHAADVDAVSATDGTVLMDITDCGFGPVK